MLAGWLVFGETLSWVFLWRSRWSLLASRSSTGRGAGARRLAPRADEVSRLFEFDMRALQTALDDERRARKLAR